MPKKLQDEQIGEKETSTETGFKRQLYHQEAEEAMSAPNKGNNHKDKATTRAAEEFNTKRARRTASTAYLGDEMPPMATMSLGMLPFTKAKKRGGGNAKEKPLSEKPEGDAQHNPQQPRPHRPHPTQILQRPLSASKNQQEADLNQFNLSEARPTSTDPHLSSLAWSPSPTSLESTSPNAVLPPQYPSEGYCHVSKAWVHNLVTQWQSGQSEMSSTPRAPRGQASAQYGIQSSGLNPNVTPSSRELNPYGRFTHDISPSSDSNDPTMVHPGAALTDSPGNFFDASGPHNDNPFNDQSRDSSTYGQSTFGPDAFGHQPTYSSLPVSAYETRPRMYNHLGQQRQQALAGPDSYGAQSPYGPQFTGNEQYPTGPQYGYGQQSTYGPQPLSDPRAGVRLPPPAVRGIPQGNSFEKDRSRKSDVDLFLARFRQMGAHNKEEALAIYMKMPPEEQTKLLDECRAQGLSDYNPANQAALTMPNVRDSAPYTGFNASSKPFDPSTTRDTLMQGLDKVAQESQNQENTPRSVRTVAHDPLAQASSNTASSVATGSTMRPHAPSYAKSSEQPDRKTRNEAERPQSRKGTDPLPGTFAADQNFANDITNKLLNELTGGPMMGYTDRGAIPSASVPLGRDRGAIPRTYAPLGGDRGPMPPEFSSLGAGNVALNKMTQKSKKTPEESLNEGVQSFRNDSYDLNKDLYEYVSKSLSDTTIRMITDNKAILPGDRPAASATPTPNPIGHGRPSTAGASPSTSTSASPATNARNSANDPWSNTSAEDMSYILTGAMANLMSHKHPKADDPFNRYGQPPAHAIDHSEDGNKSFFDETWAQTNPPARVGRDPRYQTGSQDGRSTYFENPGRGGRDSGRGGLGGQ